MTTWGRLLLDSSGHQYAEVSFGPGDTRTEDGYLLQTLTFPPLREGAQPAMLEVASVFVVNDAATASLTVTIDGSAGQPVVSNRSLSLGHNQMRVQSAVVEATSAGRELVLDLDQGEVIDGRVLQGVRTVQVSGGPEVQARTTSTDPNGQRRQLRVPLPDGLGSQVTLIFRGTFVEVRGPWKLTVQAPPDQER
jgi:hypothetical protein